MIENKRIILLRFCGFTQNYTNTCTIKKGKIKLKI